MEPDGNPIFVGVNDLNEVRVYERYGVAYIDPRQMMQAEIVQAQSNRERLHPNETVLRRQAENIFWEIVGRPKLSVQSRSIELLREWLNPAQLIQYDRMNKFSVRGSDSGDTYWICDGQFSYNVVRVDRKTKTGTRRYCFVPDGANAKGDVMLAQKIMLETNERKALAIANQYNVSEDQQRNGWMLGPDTRMTAADF